MVSRSSHLPGYLKLHQKGLLTERARMLEECLTHCALCPRECRVNRNQGEVGACGVDARPKVAAINIHPWEEPPISGIRGSGTIFFSGCTLQCVFCQNYPISQLGVGRTMTVEELAEGMLKLQARGAHNINLVTPTHQVPAVARALLIALPEGFRLPIVYNTSGYERMETLQLLDGIVDVYLPDIKYADENVARFCSKRADYVRCNRSALQEMWRQVGPLTLDEEGIAYKGLLVRHMVLPDDLSGTRACLEFLCDNMGSEIWVSLMNQYFPAHEGLRTPPLDRKVTSEEYDAALRVLTELDLQNGFVQE